MIVNLNKVIFFLLLFGFGTIHSQWSTDPANPLIVGNGLLSEVCSDSAGGCYIAFQQGTSYPTDIGLTRINRYGYQAWGGAKWIQGLLPDQNNVKIIEDGHGAVIVSYLDEFDTNTIYNYRVRVQRIDSSGNFLWGTAGVRVSLSETNQSSQALVSDGGGGCIIAWMDTNNVLRGQRVDSLGARAWGDSGIVFAGDGTGLPTIAADGQGGAVFSWRYQQLQRVNHNGDKLWSAGGVTIQGGAGKIITGKDNFFYLQGERFVGFTNGATLFVYTLQKLDTNGSFIWDSLGIVLDTLNTNLYLITDFVLQGGHATIGWSQMRNGDWDTRYQIVRNDGSKVFPDSAAWISDTNARKNFEGIIDCGQYGAILIWADNRISGGGIYAQRVDSNGTRMWSHDTPLDVQSIGGLGVTTDGNGGGILVGWRETDFTVRAQLVNRNGLLGNVITGVSEKQNRSPSKFRLEECFPNPFNPSTQISYSLGKATYVTLTVYDILGQQITTLVNGKQEIGNHSATWNAVNIPSGVYFYRIVAGNFIQTKKMVLMK